MSESKRSRRKLTVRQRLMRWTAWFLFVFSAGLMVLGAVVTPEAQLHAQEDTSTPPAIEKVESDEPGAQPTGEGQEAKDPAPAEAKPAARVASTKITFGVETEAASLGIESPTIEEKTNDDTPKIMGRAKPGQHVEVILDGESAGVIQTDADGRWSFVPGEPLSAGQHTVEVKKAAPPAPKVEDKTAEMMRPKVGEGAPSGVMDKALSFLGIFALIGVAFAMSNNRKAINWKLVGIGVGMQLAFAIFIFYIPGGKYVFSGATAVVKKLLDFTGQGSEFIFSSYVTGQWEPALINFTFAVLPTIIFFSSLMTIMYHLGIMQRIVYVVAWAMQRTMNTSGAESLSAAANIFVGQTEAPLVVKPYVDEMTNSELMTVMTGGFATVAGGVLALYVGMLEPTFPEIAGHLLAASVMSAPAALVIGKIIYPETQTPVTTGNLDMTLDSPDSNVIDAASRGASEGLQLALNVGAMLLAFIALISLLNYIISFPSLFHNTGVLADLVDAYTTHKMPIPAGCQVDGIKDAAVVGCVETMQAGLTQAGHSTAEIGGLWPMFSLQQLFGYLFAPFAFVMGVPLSDCVLIGQLLGEKMVLNELVAYSSLQKMMADPTVQLQDRSIIIATYALCGFANFGSIGIQLGGIGGLAPSRRGDLAKIAFRAMLGGTLAAFMTATIAGILV